MQPTSEPTIIQSATTDPVDMGMEFAAFVESLADRLRAVSAHHGYPVLDEDVPMAAPRGLDVWSVLCAFV